MSESHPLRLAAGLSEQQLELLLSVAAGSLARPGSPVERASRSRALRRLDERGLLVRGGLAGCELTDAGHRLVAWLRARAC